MTADDIGVGRQLEWDFLTASPASLAATTTYAGDGSRRVIIMSTDYPTGLGNGSGTFALQVLENGVWTTIGSTSNSSPTRVFRYSDYGELICRQFRVLNNTGTTGLTLSLALGKICGPLG